MALTQDQLMHLVSMAFGQGAGSGTVITPEAADALRDRYYSWLTTVKSGNQQSPLQVWGDQGGDFLGRFRLIGKIAASLANGGSVGVAQVTAASSSVEQSADCPWCP